MMETQDIQQMLAQALPGAEVTVSDMTGTRDHFQVHVLWEGFKGKGLIQQHQIVNKILAPAMEDGRIHALAIKTLAPAS